MTNLSSPSLKPVLPLVHWVSFSPAQKQIQPFPSPLCHQCFPFLLGHSHQHVNLLLFFIQKKKKKKLLIPVPPLATALFLCSPSQQNSLQELSLYLLPPIPLRLFSLYPLCTTSILVKVTENLCVVAKSNGQFSVLILAGPSAAFDTSLMSLLHLASRTPPSLGLFLPHWLLLLSPSCSLPPLTLDAPFTFAPFVVSTSLMALNTINMPTAPKFISPVQTPFPNPELCI